jgi:hypothetical protein
MDTPHRARTIEAMTVESRELRLSANDRADRRALKKALRDADREHRASIRAASRATRHAEGRSTIDFDPYLDLAERRELESLGAARRLEAHNAKLARRASLRDKGTPSVSASTIPDGDTEEVSESVERPVPSIFGTPQSDTPEEQPEQPAAPDVELGFDSGLAAVETDSARVRDVEDVVNAPDFGEDVPSFIEQEESLLGVGDTTTDDASVSSDEVTGAAAASATVEQNAALPEVDANRVAPLEVPERIAAVADQFLSINDADSEAEDEVSAPDVVPTHNTTPEPADADSTEIDQLLAQHAQEREDRARREEEDRLRREKTAERARARQAEKDLAADRRVESRAARSAELQRKRDERAAKQRARADAKDAAKKIAEDLKSEQRATAAREAQTRAEEKAAADAVALIEKDRLAEEKAASDAAALIERERLAAEKATEREADTERKRAAELAALQAKRDAKVARYEAQQEERNKKAALRKQAEDDRKATAAQRREARAAAAQRKKAARAAAAEQRAEKRRLDSEKRREASEVAALAKKEARDRAAENRSASDAIATRIRATKATTDQEIKQATRETRDARAQRREAGRIARLEQRRQPASDAVVAPGLLDGLEVDDEGNYVGTNVAYSDPPHFDVPDFSPVDHDWTESTPAGHEPEPVVLDAEREADRKFKAEKARLSREIREAAKEARTRKVQAQKAERAALAESRNNRRRNAKLTRAQEAAQKKEEKLASIRQRALDERNRLDATLGMGLATGLALSDRGEKRLEKAQKNMERRAKRRGLDTDADENQVATPHRVIIKSFDYAALDLPEDVPELEETTVG